MPSSLSELVAATGCDVSLFRSPLSDQPVGNPDTVDKWTDYAYVAGMRDDRDFYALTCVFDSPELYRQEGVLELRLSGGTSFAPRDQFAVDLAEQFQRHEGLVLKLPAAFDYPELLDLGIPVERAAAAAPQ